MVHASERPEAGQDPKQGRLTAPRWSLNDETFAGLDHQIDVVTRRTEYEKRKAEDRLEAMLLEGLNSTETELSPADWSDIRQEALAKVEARKKQSCALYFVGSLNLSIPKTFFTIL